MDRHVIAGVLDIALDIARDTNLMERFTMEMLASYPAECQEAYGRMTGTSYVIARIMVNDTTINITKTERDALAAYRDKVSAIKEVRSKWNITLKDALKVVEQLGLKWD